MAKLAGVMGVLILLNVTVVSLVFVAPGFAQTDRKAEGGGSLPGVVQALPPRTQPFWFIAVPRSSQFTVRRDTRQVDAAMASQGGPPAATGPSSRSLVPAATLPVPSQPPGGAVSDVAAPALSREVSERPAETSRRLTGPTTQPSLLTPLGLYPAGYAGAGMALLSFVTFLALACATAFVLPGRLGRVRAAVYVAPRRLVVLAVLGVLTLALTALVIQVLFMLVVSLVLTPIVAGAAAGCLFFGMVAMFLVVGGGVRSRLRLDAGNPLLDIAIGLLVVFPFTLIPAVGWLFVGLLLAIGTGAVVATRFGHTSGWSLVSLSEEAL